MSSIRKQLAAAVVTVLEADPAGEVAQPGNLTVHRERTRPITQDKLPAILAYFEDEEPTPLAKQKFQAPIVERHLNLVLELRTTPIVDQSPDEAVDPLYLWVMQQVMADERFGGLAMGVTEGPMKWMAVESDVVVAGAALHLIIHYRTSRLDPTAAS
jgi:hypothetical protein